MKKESLPSPPTKKRVASVFGFSDFLREKALQSHAVGVLKCLIRKKMLSSEPSTSTIQLTMSSVSQRRKVDIFGNAAQRLDQESEGTALRGCNAQGKVP